MKNSSCKNESLLPLCMVDDVFLVDSAAATCKNETAASKHLDPRRKRQKRGKGVLLKRPLPALHCCFCLQHFTPSSTQHSCQLSQGTNVSRPQESEQSCHVPCYAPCDVFPNFPTSPLSSPHAPGGLCFRNPAAKTVLSSTGYLSLSPHGDPTGSHVKLNYTLARLE